jgi:hypothetical protein
MQTRTYGDLFKLVQSLAGVTAFATNEQDDIANLINRRYQTAYNTSQIWPRYLAVGESRKVSAFRTGTRLGSSGGTEYDNISYYKYGEDTNGNDVFIPVNRAVNTQNDTTHFVKINSTKKWIWGAGNFSKDPITGVVSFTAGITFATQQDTDEVDSPTDVKDWGAVSNVGGQLFLTKEQVISFDETLEEESSATDNTSMDTIAEFIRIHRRRAFVNNSALEYDFFVDSRGANILNISNTADTEAFVTYKKKFVPFTTSSDYTTSTEEVPGEFFQYIAYGTYADFLRMDGQHDKAQLESENAELSLAQQLERVDAIMNNNTINKKFSTYVNRQSR